MSVPTQVFVWNGKERRTIGDLMDAMGEVTTREEGTRFMAEYRLVNRHADENIGYLTGYFGQEEAAAKRELFDVAHPIFGRRSPSPKEALAAGQAAASESNDGRQEGE